MGDQDASVKWWAKRMDYFENPATELLDLDLEDFRQVMAINLDGTLLAAQACVAPMVESGNGGSIVTIASIAAKHPDAGPIPYVCSKSAVWMLTKKMARLLATSGIRVNAIGPGYVDTHMTKMIDLIPEERLTQFLRTFLWDERVSPRRSLTPHCSSLAMRHLISLEKYCIPMAGTSPNSSVEVG